MYTLTMISNLKKGSGDRIVGVFKTLEEAQRVIENNMYDLYEGSYDYAIIEEYEEKNFGLYPAVSGYWWYKVVREENDKKEYNADNVKYVLIDKPKEVELYSNFAIG